MDAAPEPSLTVRVGCEVHYTVEVPTPFFFIVQAQATAAQRVIQQVAEVGGEAPRVGRDSFGNPLWQMLAPPGTLHLRYDALVDVSAAPDPFLLDLPQSPIESLPGEVISYLWPSRFCPSDRLMGEAWARFGHGEGGWARVQRLCDWIHEEVEYGKGSTATTDALEVYEARRAVCRDFAHLGITFCRALNLPARYVCGYLPDIGVPPDPVPMDFHAWFEVWLDGAWRTFDARHNVPRTGRVVIATGRDAADAAWATVFGAARLAQLRVWADEAAPPPHPAGGAG